MVNDSIADMLTRIRNAQTARHESVSVETSVAMAVVPGITLTNIVAAKAPHKNLFHWIISIASLSCLFLYILYNMID